MGAYNKVLKDKDENPVYPKTLARNVYLDGYTGNETGNISVEDNLNSALAKLLNGAGSWIESGEYTGTGTFGTDSPTSLRFLGEPKLVMVASKSSNAVGVFVGGGRVGVQIVPGASVSYADWSENALSWYAKSNATDQLNAAGYVYAYVAFGQGRIEG
jgi:hypothetical protein